jgi:hypothetical protein
MVGVLANHDQKDEKEVREIIFKQLLIVSPAIGKYYFLHLPFLLFIRYF